MKTNLISATAILGFSAYYNTSPFKNNPNSVSFTSELQEIKILQNKINMLEALIDYEENHNYAVPQKDLTKITGRCIGTVRSWLNSIHVGLRSSLNEKKAALTALKKDLDQYNKDDVAFILNNQNTHDKNWILQMEQNEDAKKIINCIIKYLSTTGKIPATNYIAQEINQSAPTVRKRMIEYGITSALNSTEELQELLQKIESGNFVKVKQVHNTENQENLPLIINMMRQRKLTLEGKEPININDINSKPKKPTP
ncbi:hypothetical protein IJ670_02990, partial [bacterium]|nr:hypothetical protein [bacterium]